MNSPYVFASFFYLSFFLFMATSWSFYSCSCICYLSVCGLSLCRTKPIYMCLCLSALYFSWSTFLDVYMFVGEICVHICIWVNVCTRVCAYLSFWSCPFSSMLSGLLFSHCELWHCLSSVHMMFLPVDLRYWSCLFAYCSFRSFSVSACAIILSASPWVSMRICRGFILSVLAWLGLHLDFIPFVLPLHSPFLPQPPRSSVFTWPFCSPLAFWLFYQWPPDISSELWIASE